LSGAGETLRGRSPLYAINGIPQSTPLRDGSRDGFTIDGFFIDRVEVIYGSNALQGIGGTGGIVNQVTIGAPKTEGVSGRLLLQGTADNEFSEAGMGGKAAGLVQYRAGRFDASVGAAYEVRGIFRDGEGRPVGINLTQGETQDSKTLSLFGRFGYEVTDTMRLDPHRKPGAVVDRQQPWRREFRRPDFLEPHPRHLRRRTQSDRDLPGRPDRAGRNAVRSIAEPQPQIWRQAQL
jgi:iron complex outermembrane receptor protein